MAELAANAVRTDSYQDRNPFIVGVQERVIGVDIEHLNGKAGGLRHCSQRVQHVVAKVAIRAGIKNEMGQSGAVQEFNGTKEKRALRG